MLDKIEFMLSEAAVSLRRNSLMTFAAVTTSAMALFLLGGIGLVYISLAKLATSIESKFEMRVLMKDAPSAEEIKTLGTNIGKLPGVAKVEFKSRDKVWEEFKKQNPGVVKDVGNDIENPLPDTYTVTLKDLKNVKGIASQIQAMPEVLQNGVKYLGDLQEFLEKAMSALRWTGFILGGWMLLTGGILIYNTVKLAMEARRKEMRIMELVGATRLMVVTPLLIEGAVQGLLGAIIATLILSGAYGFTVNVVTRFDQAKVPDSFPFQSTILVLGLIGLAYGLFCSIVAIREPKVKEVPR